MSVSSLEVRAEQLKLARTLGVDPKELAFLAGGDPADLKLLRERITDHLFARDARHFEGIAKLASRLPIGLAAQAAQHALGARLAAHAAALLDPKLAGEFVKRLPAPFLADIAVAADATKLAHHLGSLPTEKIGAIASELAERKEWVVMGAFVSYLSDAALDAALTALDAEARLRTGFVMEDKSRVSAVASRMTDAQLKDYLATAVRRNLLPEALDLATHVDDAELRRLAGALDSLTDKQLESLAKKVNSEPVLARAAEPLLAVASERVRDFSG